MYNYLKFILSALFLIILQGSYAQNPAPFTLGEALQQALKNNYDIILVQDQRTIEGNNVTLGNAGMLPLVQLNAGATKGVNNTHQIYSTGSETNRDNVSTTSLNYGAALDWTLFDGFRMFATYDKLKEIEQVGELNYRNQVEQTVQDVLISYYSLVSQKQLLIFWDTAVNIGQKQLQIAERKYNVGTGSKVDLIQAKITQNSNLSSRFAQQNDYDNAKIKFNQLLARDVMMKFEVPDSIPVEDIGDYETLRTKSIQHNPNLQIANRNVTISNLTLKEIASQRYPQLDLIGQYNYTRNKTGAGLILLNQNAGFTGGLTLTWNIFNGFNVNTQVKNQKLNIHQMQVQVSAAQSQVDADFNIAYNSYQNSRKLLDMNKENFDLAHQSANIALVSFNLGSINALQMKDVQKTFEQAAADLATARYNLLLAKTQLDRLCGLLPVTQ